jgi:YVTN family beta-propeller protein
MKFGLTLTVFLIFATIYFGQAVNAQEQLRLRQVAEIPLTGRATRLDYQSFDAQSGRLYIAHLGDDMVTVFDTKTQKVVGDVNNIKHVHGVLAVPELNRIYASATGTNELVVIDSQTLQIVARVPVGDYPDGIAYASKEKKVYVSNKLGKSESVIDAQTNKLVATVALDAPVGNSQYDAVSNRVFVAVHKLNQIVEIDPQTDKIANRYPLTDCKDSHGLLIDSKNRLAFAACEGNAKLVIFDLVKKKQIAVEAVGADPDVLAFDENLSQLYVSAESGILTIFDEKNGRLERVASAFFAKGAHTIAVDSVTHQVYLPLENINGKPVLRIVVPTDKQ